ncbi:hypothetical protein [Burkholderia sp. BCC0322]|nr:hypothetical protein [Burkholderia sp. BCC0322]
MTLTAVQFKEGEWGRGLAAAVLLIALVAVDRGSGRPATGWFTRWRRSPP